MSASGNFPIITVITAVLNGRRFIEDCLRSLHEEQEAVFEHLILDGGSSDGTREILTAWARRFPAIRLVFEPDQGQSDALNKGIRLARANVIGILNADDRYFPGVLGKVAKRFESMTEPALLVGNCQVLGEGERKLFLNRPRGLSVASCAFGFQLCPHPINPSAYFYHRSLHDHVGFYDVSDHYAMDLDFLMRAFRVAHVEKWQETLGCYRYLPGTKSFQDRRSGRAFLRYESLMRRHAASLPWWQRLPAAVARWLTVSGPPAWIHKAISRGR